MQVYFSHYANAVGILGVLLTLLAYLLLNMNKISADNYSYLYLNFFGSILLLYSLVFHWNLSSVLIEIAWISISLLGLWRAYRSRMQLKRTRGSV